MTMRAALMALPLACLAAGPALAQATPDEAARLTSVFQTYLGDVDGVVTVTPDGAAYAASFDFTPLAALLPDDALSLEMTPITYALTDLGDGRWRVTEDQAISITAEIGGVLTYSITTGRSVSDSVWNEALWSFESSRSEVTDMRFASKAVAADGTVLSDDVQSFDSFSTTMAAIAAPGGGVDARVDYSARGMRQTSVLPVFGPGMPAQTLSLSADTYSAQSGVAGLRTEQLLQLMAWAVANLPSREAEAAQDELKAVLSALMPLFDRLEMDGDITVLEVRLPGMLFGLPGEAQASVARLGVEMDVNGFVADGRVREAITLSGLSLSDGMVPDWAAGLVPADLMLDVEVSRFDLAAPVATLIGAFDLSAPEPVDQMTGMMMLGQLMPEGVVDVTLAPGSVTGGLYRLSYEGALTTGPGVMPTGAGRVELVGMEAIQQALSEAPPDIAGELMPGLGMAMSLAQPGADRALVWDIDARQPGTLKVNGLDMMGGP